MRFKLLCLFPSVRVNHFLRIYYERRTQGCNSRVFRATLRRQDQPSCPNEDTDKGTKGISSRDNSRPAPTASPVPVGGKRGRDGGSSSSTTTTPQRGGVVNSIVGMGEQFWNGSFGACFSGSNHVEARGGDAEAKKAPNLEGTEWALKMALTLAGQDPQQVRQQ